MESYIVKWKAHHVEVTRWLREIEEDKRLHLYLSMGYLRLVETKIAYLFTHCKAVNILPLFDKESVENLFLLSEWVLKGIFDKWVGAVVVKKSEIETGSTLSYLIRYDTRKPVELRTTITDVEKNTRIFTQCVERAESMDTIQELITQHETLYGEIEKVILAFIDRTNLRAYYLPSDNTLETRVDILMEWLRNRLRVNDLSISMDFTKDHLLRQLLTADPAWSIDKMLEKVITHECIHAKIKGAPHRKRRVHISCKQLCRNNVSLVEQLQHNAHLFNNATEYSSLLTLRNRKDSSFLDVFIITLEDSEDIPRGMTILEKPLYAKMQERIIKMQNFKVQDDDESDDDLSIMTPARARKAKMTQAFITKSIHDNLDQVVIATEKEELDIPEAMKRALAKITRKIYDDGNSGVHGAMNTMNDTLEQVFTDARRTFQKKGSECFPGPLSMTKEMIRLENFDEITDDSSNLVKKIMKSKNNRAKIQQHRDKNKNVDLLSIKHIDQTLSRGVLPCAVDPKYYYINNPTIISKGNITINNITVALTQPTRNSLPTARTRNTNQVTELRPSKKRKRIESDRLHERYKRIRGFSESRVGDETIQVYRRENLMIAEPNLNDAQTCLVCEKLKTLKFFAKEARNRDTDGVVHRKLHVYNICETCMRHARSIKMKEKEEEEEEEEEDQSTVLTI